jgi:hypothetical protein
MGAYINQHRPKLHLTVEEAARRFGVSPQTLALAIRRHQLYAKRAAHHYWVAPTAVSLYLEKQRATLHAA